MTSRSCGGPDAASHHPRRVAVGAAGHPEDRLVHQQQRRGEIQAAGEREQGAAKDHPGGEDIIYVTLNRHISVIKHAPPNARRIMYITVLVHV